MSICVICDKFKLKSIITWYSRFIYFAFCIYCSFYRARHIAEALAVSSSLYHGLPNIRNTVHFLFSHLHSNTNCETLHTAFRRFQRPSGQWDIQVYHTWTTCLRQLIPGKKLTHTEDSNLHNTPV